MSIRVLIGMSGGIDSSVSAHLLKEMGYEVVGVFMHLHNIDEEARDSAKEMANFLDIEFHVIDYRKEFKDKIISPFIEEYLRAKTPNPCIMCNELIKFGKMNELRKDFSCEKISTGHYAKIIKEKGSYGLYKGNDKKKDQSYFLYRIDKNLLPDIIFPLGDYEKSEVKKIAEELGFPVYKKPESQEICFVPEDDFPKFIECSLGRSFKEGDIIDEVGNIIGIHKGIERYTIGQRKGLGVALGYKAFVSEIDPIKRTITLAREDSLLKSEVVATNINFLEEVPDIFRAKAKIRYSIETHPCLVRREEEKIIVSFDDHVRAPTRGQSIVLYDEERVIGGGIIQFTK